MSLNTLYERIFFVMRKTQQDIGAELGVSQDTVSLWKRGKSSPSIDKLEIICHKTGVDLVWLINGKTANIESLINAYLPLNSDRIANNEDYRHARELVGNALVKEMFSCDTQGRDSSLRAASIYYMSALGICTRSPSEFASPNGDGDYDDVINAALRLEREVYGVLNEDERTGITYIFSQIRNDFLSTDTLFSAHESSELSIRNSMAVGRFGNYLPLIGSAAADNAAASRAEIEPEAPGEEVQVLKEHYRLVRIVGNSMEPVILDGQYAVIGSEIGKGDTIRAKGWLGIIQVDCSGLEDGICEGVATFCKRVYPIDKKTLLLTSINTSECAPFTVARQHVLHLWPVHGVFFMGHGVTPNDQ